MSSTRMLLLASMIVATASAARASLIVYDTFGPGNSFTLNTGYTISGATSGVGYFIQGDGFKALATGPGLTLDIAMGHVQGQPPQVIMTLYADNGAGQLGAQIGNPVTVNLNPGSFGTPAAYVSVSLAGSGWSFVAGQDYWLLAEAPSAVWNAWNWNDQNINGRHAWRDASNPNNPWNYNPNTLQGAFRLTAVPEPASLLALGAGLAAILARRRRSA